MMDRLEITDDAVSAADAVALLDKMGRDCKEAAARLPKLAIAENVWDGLMFSVSGVRVVSMLQDINEMLPMQERITRVPGARPWMLGLANVRGSLMPVIDLQLFLGGKALVPSKTARILVLRQHELVTGLLVSSVQGMVHFANEDKIADARMKGTLGAYVYEAFRIEDDVWPVFSMAALAADPDFRSALMR